MSSVFPFHPPTPLYLFNPLFYEGIFMRIDYNKGGLLSPELVNVQRKTGKDSNGPKAKVMLVFPPDWYPSEPYLSLPTLTSFLRCAGHEVVQKDVNLECMIGSSAPSF